MDKPKEYVIDSFDKLCNVVNNENAERLAIDLAQWLLFYNKIITEQRAAHPEQTKDLKNTDIAKSFFKWIDDGKNDITGVELKNSDTGELKKIDFKQKTKCK